MAHHVIYLPGLSDHKSYPIQVRALEKWRNFGLDPQLQHIGWNNNESYKLKLAKIIKAIDKLPPKDTVSLVGASAGCSMAVNVYAQRKSRINAIVLICGKINNPQTIKEYRKSNNPSLLECVIASAQNVQRLDNEDKPKILVIQPIFDGVVTKSDGRIPDVQHKTIIAIWHSVAIYLSLTLYKRISINFLKSHAVQ
jgi:predicted peptidase